MGFKGAVLYFDCLNVFTYSLRVELYDIDHSTIKDWPKNNLSNGAAGSVNGCTESTIN